MNSFLLTIAAVQILHCSGVPSPKDALRESVRKLNEITETTNLCGITRRRVKDIYRTGKLSFNVDLTFSVKETICSKNSGLEFDDPSCHFHPRKTSEKGFCKSRVEYFADKVVDIDVECRGLKTVDSSSDSSESSEDSIEVKSKSQEMSLEVSSNVKSKSNELSLESEAKELSLESEAKELSLESKSEELSLDSKSNELSLESKSEELSFKKSSNNFTVHGEKIQGKQLGNTGKTARNFKETSLEDDENNQFGTIRRGQQLPDGVAGPPQERVEAEVANEEKEEEEDDEDFREAWRWTHDPVRLIIFRKAQKETMN
uniref:uncharacterized protein n=1 Tax=Pristiophorus japonicus TaxID=55135 RepID=UPI00398EB09C